MKTIDASIPYRVRHDAVVQEFVEDEYIVINMETGNYYSLGGGAIPAWKLLAAGVSAEQAISLLSDHYGISAADVSESVMPVFTSVLEQGLITTATAEECEPTCDVLTGTEIDESFTTPRFEVYSDVQDLLLLDPVHDVTEAGWPESSEA